MEPVVAVLAVLIMLVGLVGVVVPVLPGLLLVWLAAAGTTLWVATDAAGWIVVGILTVLFGLGTAATVWLPTRHGVRGGIPAASLGAAAAGAVVGFFVIPVAGFLVGGFAALLLAEGRRLGDWRAALGSVVTVVRAYGIGVVVELAFGLTMIAVWAVAAVLR